MGGPRTSVKRGSRQATASTTNEMVRASAAPITTKENGSGRSCRDAIPCSGTSMISLASPQRAFKITMILPRWCDSTS